MKTNKFANHITTEDGAEFCWKGLFSIWDFRKFQDFPVC